jgi:hypothetical protein
MTDSQFFNSLKSLLHSLESLQQYPQFQQLCDAAIEDGELTLGDAVQAIRYAAHSPIPTTNFN